MDNRSYMFDLVANNANRGATGSNQADPSKSSVQQKRQSSMSNYLGSNNNKRIFNPLQLPMAMQRPTGQDYTFDAATPQTNPPTSRYNTTTNVNVSNNSSLGGNNHSVRKNLMQLNVPTPTPSGFELPSSPNLPQPTNVSPQNNSDLSEYNMGINQASKESTKEPILNVTPSNTYLDQPQATQLSSQQRVMSEEEQQLASKLKETYKNIVNFEEVVQKNCIEVTMKINQLSNGGSLSNVGTSAYSNPLFPTHQLSSSLTSNSPLNMSQTRSSELLNDLWTVYHHNVILLDNYYDFLVTALKPSSNQTEFKTGKNIVDLYKIPRRMWVYGVVGFLEVLKNVMNIFQEHDICLCFIAYCFNIVSNLTDSNLEMEGWWLEKLGDLSRMAIALYSTKFIDWKSSAEYWYTIAMKTLYGHGKIYYHVCTVQQDNLDALVNIGKSVICHDPFVPTQHYLRLVVENICTQRNILSLLELPIIDFIKIHKVLLSIHSTSFSSHIAGDSVENIHDTQLQYGIDLVTRYGLTFGSDSNGYNFFTRELYTPSGVASPNDAHHPYYLQQQQTTTANTIEKMNFWFNKGPLFAIANVNHLIGFGDPKNPFAKIFGLPEALKGRKDKKDKKARAKLQEAGDEIVGVDETGQSIEGPSISALDLSRHDWFRCLQYINKSVLELSIRILRHYLTGPRQASTSHIIVWFYFLIAVGEATVKFPESKTMFIWLIRKMLPWEHIINYLNSLLEIIRSNSKLNFMCSDYLAGYPGYTNFIDYFNENEFLPEVWKCWGTIWFDIINAKRDFVDLESAGVIDDGIFDLPSCGTSPMGSMSSGREGRSRDQQDHYNDERIVRVILLAIHIAETYQFGLIRNNQRFGFEEETYRNNDNLISSLNDSEVYGHVERFLFSDGRFMQNHFMQPISKDNLMSRQEINGISSTEKDAAWFEIQQTPSENQGKDLEYYVADDDDMEGYADSEIENEADMKDRYHDNVHQQQHNRAVQQARMSFNDDVESYLTSEIVHDTIGNSGTIEGNLGDRMDTNVTYITLDTIIWLKHCGRIYKCVRNHVFKVLIPIIVFQELRSLRKSAEATIADAATRSVIIIRELYATKDILPLRFDGTVASDINEITEFEHNSNWKSNVDETILRSVNEHDELGKNLSKGLNMTINPPAVDNSESWPTLLNTKTAKLFRYCILITDDRNIRLKAKTIGLASFQSKWLFHQLEILFPQCCID
ncbi:uncharacterized protein PRCAT00006336001 [Priceomyces carsonii]|uniref:uncharacterized protein n=1 Tax=Priceomyces carsonii TaxID=28549 RepID=UPI002EDB09A2|nr:unnamed protein product [Priceomyces carsonii]